MILEEILDRTIIMITHRVELLKNFDKIFVMSNGYIVDEGTYNELITKKS